MRPGFSSTTGAALEGPLVPGGSGGRQGRDFQTPPWVCELILDKLVWMPDSHEHGGTILEPTPGQGNIVSAIKSHFPDANIIAPEDFWNIPTDSKFDAIVANPPFSPMSTGYAMLGRFMEMSDIVIALMPWLTLINSQKRTAEIMKYGLVEVTHLPRSAFPGSRVQTCILSLHRGWQNDTTFSVADELGGQQ